MLGSAYGNPYGYPNSVVPLGYQTNALNNPMVNHPNSSITSTSNVQTPSPAPSASGLSASLFREEIVISAIRFLQSPEVLKSSILDRVKYLEDKSLTSSEIAEAFARALPNARETEIIISAATRGQLASAALENLHNEGTNDSVDNSSSASAPGPASSFSSSTSTTPSQPPLAASGSPPAPRLSLPAQRAVNHVAATHGASRGGWLWTVLAGAAAVGAGVLGWQHMQGGVGSMDQEDIFGSAGDGDGVDGTDSTDEAYERDIAYLRAHAEETAANREGAGVGEGGLSEGELGSAMGGGEVMGDRIGGNRVGESGIYASGVHGNGNVKKRMDEVRVNLTTLAGEDVSVRAARCAQLAMEGVEGVKREVEGVKNQVEGVKSEISSVRMLLQEISETCDRMRVDVEDIRTRTADTRTMAAGVDTHSTIPNVTTSTSTTSDVGAYANGTATGKITGPAGGIGGGMGASGVGAETVDTGTGAVAARLDALAAKVDVLAAAVTRLAGPVNMQHGQNQQQQQQLSAAPLAGYSSENNNINVSDGASFNGSGSLCADGSNIESDHANQDTRAFPEGLSGVDTLNTASPESLRNEQSLGSDQTSVTADLIPVVPVPPSLSPTMPTPTSASAFTPASTKDVINTADDTTIATPTPAITNAITPNAVAMSATAAEPTASPTGNANIDGARFAETAGVGAALGSEEANNASTTASVVESVTDTATASIVSDNVATINAADAATVSSAAAVANAQARERTLSAALLVWRHSQCRALRAAVSLIRRNVHTTTTVPREPVPTDPWYSDDEDNGTHDDNSNNSVDNFDQDDLSPSLPLLTSSSPTVRVITAGTPARPSYARSLRVLHMYCKNARRNPRVLSYLRLPCSQAVLKQALALPGIPELLRISGFRASATHWELALPAIIPDGYPPAGTPLPRGMAAVPGLSVGIRISVPSQTTITNSSLGDSDGTSSATHNTATDCLSTASSTSDTASTASTASFEVLLPASMRTTIAAPLIALLTTPFTPPRDLILDELREAALTMVGTVAEVALALATECEGGAVAGCVLRAVEREEAWLKLCAETQAQMQMQMQMHTQTPCIHAHTSMETVPSANASSTLPTPAHPTSSPLAACPTLPVTPGSSSALTPVQEHQIATANALATHSLAGLLGARAGDVADPSKNADTAMDIADAPDSVLNTNTDTSTDTKANANLSFVPDSGTASTVVSDLASMVTVSPHAEVNLGAVVANEAVMTSTSTSTSAPVLVGTVLPSSPSAKAAADAATDASVDAVTNTDITISAVTATGTSTGTNTDADSVTNVVIATATTTLSTADTNTNVEAGTDTNGDANNDIDIDIDATADADVKVSAAHSNHATTTTTPTAAALVSPPTVPTLPVLSTASFSTRSEASQHADAAINTEDSFLLTSPPRQISKRTHTPIVHYDTLRARAQSRSPHPTPVTTPVLDGHSRSSLSTPTATPTVRAKSGGRRGTSKSLGTERDKNSD